MNLDDAIVLETFPNRIAAEMAAGLLESEGVEAMVVADDAGGDLSPAPVHPGRAPPGVPGGRGPGPGDSPGHGGPGRAGAGIGGKCSRRL